MVARYRRLSRTSGYDWGRERIAAGEELYRVLAYANPGGLKGLVRAGFPESPRDWESFLRAALPEPLPLGIALASASTIRISEVLPMAVEGHPVHYLLVETGQSGCLGRVVEVLVEPGDPYLRSGGKEVRAAELVAAGRLRLKAGSRSRWSVVDHRGGAWFPEGALRKFDQHGRPFFHGDEIELDVPAGRMTITVTRGCEFRTSEAECTVSPGGEALVELSPVPLYDAAARGWYGGDLHVHLNYPGDQVAGLDDAASMQRGEGLHLMNLVAANAATALIYDFEGFECFAGLNLPWSGHDAVGRWGVEYRNDLFGHFHALNLTAPPTRYQTGHERSAERYDWPPNAVAAAECRELGASVGYTHPIGQPMAPDGSPAPVFDAGIPRSMEAREVVADAALGLVDSLDLVGPSNAEGTEFLYHRLLGCGIRLSATAGTDTMLSNSRFFFASNPPGWSRVYANLRGHSLTAESWQEAVRAGRTFATNGPWLEMTTAGGHEIGDTLRAAEGDVVTVQVRVVGLGVEKLEVMGPDGPFVVRELGEGVEECFVDVDVELHRPLWIAAIARGGPHPSVCGRHVYAHTSPLWIDVGGATVARRQDAAWCLDWLDRLEAFCDDHDRFAGAAQRADLGDVIERARAFYQTIASGERAT